MRVLGIETSCDETAVCLIEANGDFGSDFKYKVLGNGLLSQAALHAQYGGVFPNLAKREHAKNLVPLLHKVLEEAGSLKPNTGAASDRYQGPTLVKIPRSDLGKTLEREPELFALIVPFLLKFQKPDIDAIAVTAGPGLEPALWVGINFAKALSIVWNIPLVAVNHMEGHIVMPLVEHTNIPKYMSMSGGLKQFEFPVLSLLISGGHTELVLSKQFGQYQLIGETRDDAAGEAFDKVARLMELGYPGGPLISALAAEAREENIKGDFSFTRPMLHDGTFDFSFSGLKTAVRRVVESCQGDALTVEVKKQVAREFEECVADVLTAKTLRAVEEYGARTVVVGGGVSANTYIREHLAEALKKADASAELPPGRALWAALLTPPPELATDNALMIALAGYFHALKSDFADPMTLAAKGNLKLDQ